LLFLGAACLAQNKLPEAVTHLRQAVQLQPGMAEALHNLGVALAQQRNYPEASDLLRRAAQARPEWMEPLLDLGTVYREQGLLDDALRCYQQALAVNNTAALHNLVGTTLSLQGRIRDALVHFEEALRQQPRYRVAH